MLPRYTYPVAVAKTSWTSPFQDRISLVPVAGAESRRSGFHGYCDFFSVFGGGAFSCIFWVIACANFA